MNGFILINKPKGVSSFFVIKKLRAITNIKKIGHAGTLDPMAEGLLICAIGREYTKKIGYFLKADKEYITTIKLGEKSSTYDAEGEIEKVSFEKTPSLEDIKKTLQKFTGEQNQMPPDHSAKKIKGVPAYKLARQNKEVNLKTSKINIYSIDLIKYEWPYLEIKVHSSSGTYIRSLGNDIGNTLGTGGHLIKLTRTKIKEHSLDNAINLADLNEKNWKDYLFET